MTHPSQSTSAAHDWPQIWGDQHQHVFSAARDLPPNRLEETRCQIVALQGKGASWHEAGRSLRHLAGLSQAASSVPS